ncbi:TetR/AcrR family transcriptional regulator [Clostridium sp.]|uniref:TetR/AcrR family transcriptional regulator n=1 Tax=Clostridium sp. TaxID=1506 RepID=UPI001A424AF5|nr:TetR/AcrR family transcriptional regulator [Clostridium sp.]MBK5236744.1 TetR/AcrR family transcriptional regulator [Clostridium sp.]
MAGLREKQKKQREDRIIDASLKLFTTKGFNETTMEEIAEKAEVGVGTLYNYMKSKGDLLLLIFTQKTENIYIKAEKILENPTENLIETLMNLLKIYLEGILSLPKNLSRYFLSVVFSQQYNENNLNEDLMKLDYKLMGQLRNLLDWYKEKGLIDCGINTEILSFNIYSILITHYTVAVLQDNASLEMTYEFMKLQIELQYTGFKQVK